MLIEFTPGKNTIFSLVVSGTGCLDWLDISNHKTITVFKPAIQSVGLTKNTERKSNRSSTKLNV